MQRYIPFGYRIENGETAVDDAEAAMVKKVFEMYIDGASYKTIAEYMESAGVNYRQDSATWNKNMVKRILENARYTGAGEYPVIIEKSAYTQVTAIISKKGGVQGKSHPMDILKGKIACSECGNEYVRVYDKRRVLTWRCKNRRCETSPLLSDEMIISKIIDIMNRIIENPAQITTPAADTSEPNLNIKRLNNEVNREFNGRELDKNRIMVLMMELAGEKYKSCDDGASERDTEKLRELFSRQKQIRSLHGGLFEKTVRRLYIQKNSTVQLELINNQII